MSLTRTNASAVGISGLEPERMSIRLLLRSLMSILPSRSAFSPSRCAVRMLSGNALRALNHAGTRLETTLLMAWRTRRTIISFGRRWLTNSPLARRWNQRLYRGVGLGALRSARPPAPRARRSSTPPAATPSASGRTRRAPGEGAKGPKKAADPPEDFKLK
jgi:hypothetical protein